MHNTDVTCTTWSGYDDKDMAEVEDRVVDDSRGLPWKINLKLWKMLVDLGKVRFAIFGDGAQREEIELACKSKGLTVSSKGYIFGDVTRGLIALTRRLDAAFFQGRSVQGCAQAQTTREQRGLTCDSVGASPGSLPLGDWE